MPREIQIYIPEPDRILFQRCRMLNKEISDICAHMETPETLDNLKRLLLPEIPSDVKLRAEKAIARQERESARLEALQDELDQIAEQAEQAAERIENVHLRRFVKAYSLDACSNREATFEARVCERTGARYAALLNRPPDNAVLEGNNHARETHQGGTGRR